MSEHEYRLSVDRLLDELDDEPELPFDDDPEEIDRLLEEECGMAPSRKRRKK